MEKNGMLADFFSTFLDFNTKNKKLHIFTEVIYGKKNP